MKYLRNTKTGEIHQLDEDGRSLEECNVDAIPPASRQELTKEAAVRRAAAAPSVRCGHCWKERAD